MSSATERKYRGVRLCKWGKWVSEIRLPNSRERIWLGSYDTSEKAARAFDAAFVCLRGAGADGAGINFPDSPPAVARTSDPEEVYAAAVSHANRPSLARAQAAAAAVLPRDEAQVVVRGKVVVLAPLVQVPVAGSFDWSQNPLYSPTCSYDLPTWIMTHAAAEESMEEDDEGTTDKLWSFHYSTPTHPTGRA